MVRAWAAGRDVDATGASSRRRAWQAELWRRLRARIGQPDPAERLEAACARLREEPGLVELPDAAVAVRPHPAARRPARRCCARSPPARDVHLFLLHPSPALWERGRRRRRAVVAPRRRRHRELPANRLLASWGQDVRELQLVLGAAGDADHHHPTHAATGTLLAAHPGRRARRPPAARAAARRPARRAARARPATAASQVHACHGRARQVEVLRDAILHLLAEDPTLEPRDVIVMCPDIETFAPLIQRDVRRRRGRGRGRRARGAARRVRPPDLRVRLADRSLRQTNPVLGVVARLLELADAAADRLAGARPRRPRAGPPALRPRRRRRSRGWRSGSPAAGIRWGLDAAHRAPFKLDELAAGHVARRAWTACCSASTMTEDEQRLFGGVLPLDDVESGAIDLAGRFAELRRPAAGRRSTRCASRRRSAAGPRRSPPRPTR